MRWYIEEVYPPTVRYIKPGMTVDIVLKKDQRSGTLTRAVVARLLTKSKNLHHGIKLMFDDGQVGRVKVILP